MGAMRMSASATRLQRLSHQLQPSPGPQASSAGISSAAAAAASTAAPRGGARKKVRLAVIGVGSGVGGSGIGERHLNHALDEAAAFEVVAVVDPADRGVELARQHGLVHYRDTEAMLREVRPGCREPGFGRMAVLEREVPNLLAGLA
jgi:hypothetical protein